MQLFRVILRQVGANRLPVLTQVALVTGLPPKECKRLSDAGDLVVANDVHRGDAEDLARKLTGLGATAEVELSDDGCCHDYFPGISN